MTRRWRSEPGRDLAKARIRAHGALDALWKLEIMSRSEAYRRLASAMRTPAHECHIGMFDLAQCAEVERLCEQGALL